MMFKREMIMFNRLKLLFLSVIVFPACFNPSPKLRPTGSLLLQQGSSFYDLTAVQLDGRVFDFDALKGKKVVIINTASKCGYTKQYEDWEKFSKSQRNGVVVLGFPSNQFLNQEPGNNEQIASFCKLNYGVSFTMFEKCDVKGNKQHEVYQWLCQKSKNGWNEQHPAWNFCKYVIDEHGQLLAFFPSKTLPTDGDFLKLINN